MTDWREETFSNIVTNKFVCTGSQILALAPGLRETHKDLHWEVGDTWKVKKKQLSANCTTNYMYIYWDSTTSDIFVSFRNAWVMSSADYQFSLYFNT